MHKFLFRKKKEVCILLWVVAREEGKILVKKKKIRITITAIWYSNLGAPNGHLSILSPMVLFFK